MRVQSRAKRIPTRVGGATIVNIADNTFRYIDFTTLPGFDKTVGTRWVSILAPALATAARYGIRYVDIDEATPSDLTDGLWVSTPGSPSNVINYSGFNASSAANMSLILRYKDIRCKGVAIKRFFASGSTDDFVITCGY